MTYKKYCKNYEELNNLKKESEELFKKIDGLTIDDSIVIRYYELKKIIQNHTNELETAMKEYEVNVQYSIGYRNYYEQVYKIGKTYFFSNCEKLTKANCYHVKKEIDVITVDMRAQMLDDMYYY